MSSVIGLITILVYLILLPLLVFFFLKDKIVIIQWLRRFFPKEDELVVRVWRDVDRQIGNYVRGKFWEIIIVWLVSYLTFLLLGLQYAMVLSVCLGISVLVPFVGVAVITIPVVLVAWFQWGWSADFAYLVGAYIVIKELDANLLVPLLFSEVNNLHPVAIIVAVLLFGGLWGVLGLFFAIPLANLVQAVVNAWPRLEQPKPSLE
jgi:putative permease